MFTQSLKTLYRSFTSDFRKDTCLSRRALWLKTSLVLIPVLTALTPGPYALMASFISFISLMVLSKTLANMADLIKGLTPAIVFLIASLFLANIYAGYNIAESVIHALLPVYRLLILAGSFLIFSRITSFKELINAAESLKIPKGLTYSFILTLRFIPLLTKDLINVNDSMRVRGLNIKGGRVKGLLKLRHYLIPLVVISIRRIDKVAEALELRGFIDDD